MSKHFTNIFFAHDTLNHYCSQLIIHTKFEEFFLQVVHKNESYKSIYKLHMRCNRRCAVKIIHVR
jgi:hypothetical protein